MYIELKGVGTINKGAYLMLLAIMDKFASTNADVKFVSESGFGMDYYSMAKLEILQKFNPEFRKIPFESLLNFLPKKKRLSYGLVLPKEINAVLDGSGFVYGDSWGAKKIESRLGKEITSLKKNKTKVILLPQAFGPFNNLETKNAFQPIVDNADLIFCRDRISYDYINSSYGNRDNVKLAPDFTNLLKIQDSVQANLSSNKVCIIPNYKMLSEGSTGSKYFEFLIASIEYVQLKGLTPFFLIHEGKKDIDIAEKVNTSLSKPINIISDAGPLEIKKYIKESKFIIVSRFHGLVSALSQGVPAVTTSWSHKYEMLIADYNSPELLVKISGEDSHIEEVKALIDKLCNDKEYEIIQSRIRKGCSDQEEKSEAMWSLVFECLNIKYI